MTKLPYCLPDQNRKNFDLKRTPIFWNVKKNKLLIRLDSATETDSEAAQAYLGGAERRGRLEPNFIEFS